MLPTLDYAFYHIERVIRIVRGDEKALNEMDISSDGFWRSFAAFLFCLPAFFFGWAMDWRTYQAEGAPITLGYAFSTSAFIELANWLLPVLLLALTLKPLGLEKRFSHLIIARNWLTIPVAYFYTLFDLPAFFVIGYEPPVALIMITLIVFMVVLAQVTKICLQTEMTVAAALVIGEFIIMVGFLVFTYRAFGFSDLAGSS